mmetsp:Transcript_1207/g.2024  ORF Transcript_1207/g.2024 Transcript_1207/m.2024 type:complete len:347 (+) Transcript_1207:46-1086(+)
MLKYVSHAVYCVLLCLLLAHCEDTFRGEDNLLLRGFLRAFVLWNVTHFCAAVFIFDLYGVHYSSKSDTIPSFDLLAVVAYALAIFINLGSCTVAMAIQRIAFGFSLQTELSAAALLLLAYHVANIHYNMTAFARLEPFWSSKGLDLRKHQRWSFALSNMGLTFRLFKRVLLFVLSSLLWPTVPTLDELYPSWQYPKTWAMLSVILCTPLSLAFTFFQYHLVHAWLHSNGTLYHMVHKVHHLARYPIPSDSGTISPLEFALHEITLPKVIAPFWFWLPGEIFIGIQHRKDHTFELGNAELREGKFDGSAWHMLHHSKNVGNYSFQPLDKLFGTMIDVSKVAPFARSS